MWCGPWTINTYNSQNLRLNMYPKLTEPECLGFGIQECMCLQILQGIIKHLSFERAALNDVSWHQLISPCEIKSFTAQVSTTGSSIFTTVGLAGGLREEAECPCGTSPMSSQRENALQNSCHCVLSVG